LDQTPLENPDPVGLIVSWLKQDDTVSGFVGGRIGRLGEYRDASSYIEIGHTMLEPASGSSRVQHIVSIHIWSRRGGPAELEEVLQCAERAIVSQDSPLDLKREFSEVRYDEEQGAYHGLLRINVLSEGLSEDEYRE
jgi:hypothetical protein